MLMYKYTHNVELSLDQFRPCIKFGFNLILSRKYISYYYLDLMVLVMVHSEVKNWIKYARFEEKNQYINSCRRIYERAVQYFGEDNISETLIIAFAKFEEGQKEVIFYRLIVVGEK